MSSQRESLDDVSNAQAPWQLVLGPPAGEVRAAVARDGGGPEAPSAQPAPAPAEWLASRTGVRVGATIEKRFPGYGTHRGTVVELGADDVVVRWETDERTTLSIKEASRRVIAAPARKTERVAPAPANDGGRILTLLDAASAPAPPRHILLQNDDDDDAVSGITSPATTLSTKPQGKKPRGKGHLVKGRTESRTEHRARVVPADPARGYEKTSKFWGVTWHIGRKLWQAYYRDKEDKLRTIGYYPTEELAALAVNKAVSDTDGLVGVPNTMGRDGELKKHERRTNAVDASGAPVPKPEAARRRGNVAFDRSKVVPPDPARIAAGLTPSRFYHVHWDENHGRWSAGFKLRQGEGEKKKNVALGYHDTEEAAALAVNAALLALPPEVRGGAHINPVDANGKLVPHDRKSPRAAQAPTKKRKAAESGAAADDAEKPLASRTNLELKAICRSRNLPVWGKKAELVQRIVDDDAKPAAKRGKKSAKKSAKKKHCFEDVDYGRPYATKRRRTAAPDADADGFHAAAGHLLACLDAAAQP